MPKGVPSSNYTWTAARARANLTDDDALCCTPLQPIKRLCTSRPCLRLRKHAPRAVQCGSASCQPFWPRSTLATALLSPAHTPIHTVRPHRLASLAQRDPPDLWGALRACRVRVLRYHFSDRAPYLGIFFPSSSPEVRAVPPARDRSASLFK